MAGRPTLFTHDLAERILSLVRLGHSASAASEACGISERTLRKWIKQGREEPEAYPYLAEFLPRYLAAQSTAIVELEGKAIAAAKVDGDLALKILERRRWRDWSQQAWRIRAQEKENRELRQEIEDLRRLISERY